VATGFASLPRDISPPPREWAERFFNIQHWTEMPRGGHWAAMEEPELLADDLRAFLPSLARSAAVSRLYRACHSYPVGGAISTAT